MVDRFCSACRECGKVGTSPWKAECRDWMLGVEGGWSIKRGERVKCERSEDGIWELFDAIADVELLSPVNERWYIEQLDTIDELYILHGTTSRNFYKNIVNLIRIKLSMLTYFFSN